MEFSESLDEKLNIIESLLLILSEFSSIQFFWEVGKAYWNL